MMRNAVRFALMFALVGPACGRAVAADPPRLTAISLDGQPWRSSEHVGKVVVVDFWATWCGPCIDQIPQLQKLYLSHRGHPDFEMVSVALDTDAERVGRVAAQHHLTWTQALDPAGPLRNEIMTLASHRIPALAILRKSGALDGVWHDARDADFSLRALLSGSRAALEHPPEDHAWLPGAPVAQIAFRSPARYWTGCAPSARFAGGAPGGCTAH